MDRLTAAQGLTDNLINQIVADTGGALWLGSHRGVFRVPIEQLNAVCDGRQSRVRSLALGGNEGLRGSETNGEVQPAGCRTGDGRLWFPTAHGVAVVDPAAIPFVPRTEPVLIERVRATDRIVYGLGLTDEAAPGTLAAEALPERVAGPMTLPPGSGRFLEFRYALVDLVAPEQVRFRYRLEGHDADWIDAGRRRAATYTNLRPGRYRFLVSARNHHGRWTEEAEVAMFAFRLTPHLHERWPVRGLLLGAVLAGVYALHRGRLRWRVRLERLEAEHRWALERGRIARDLHDDLGASLARAAILLGLARQGREAAVAEASQSRLDQVQETLRASQQTMRELIWATDPRNDTLEGLVTRVCQFAQEYLEPWQMRCRFELPGTWPAAPLSAEARQNLFLAAKEAIRNAAQHGQASELRIAVGFADGHCHVTIADNGRGLPTPVQPGGVAQGGSGDEPDGQAAGRPGLGLMNMRERLAALGGRLTLASVPGQGTTVRLEVPLVP